MIEKKIVERGITMFLVPYEDLELATDNFAESNKIGSGGFGNVYSGNFEGKEVAVKVLLAPGDADQVKAFRQEVNILRELQHPHLVRLIGACPEKFAIIYEFMRGGSLEDQLVHKKLLWKHRLRIATEICHALVFLHSPDPYIVVHGDVKPENILLDGSGRSKLSDFGICRLMPISNTTTTIRHTTAVQGSFGYLDPDFIQSGKLAPSADVYSFGMVLLRLLTKGQPGHGLIEKVQDAIEEEHLENIVDVTAEWPYQLAEELFQVALRCVDYQAKHRPNLTEVLYILENLKLKYLAYKFHSLKLQQATSTELGEVVFGRMYRAKLRGREAMMTMLLGFDDAFLKEAFKQEVDMLDRLRHPHIVPSVGICPEKYTIFFDCKIEGTLEDRLVRKDLLWQDRTRIATEICSAVVLLQEQKPEIVIHGDLHPKNVLLDISGRSMLYNFTDIGKEMLPPDVKTSLAETGSLEPSIDVYWFGLLLLRLLSYGWDVDWLLTVIDLFKDENSFGTLLDRSAEWPSVVANDLLDLALTCCNNGLQDSISGVISIAEVFLKLDEITKRYIDVSTDFI